MMKKINNYHLFLAGILSEEKYLKLLEAEDPLMANLSIPNAIPKSDQTITQEVTNEQKLLTYLSMNKDKIKKFVAINPNLMSPKKFYGFTYSGDDISFAPPRWNGQKMLLRNGFMIGGPDPDNLESDFFGISPQEFAKNYRPAQELV
jgi:hypothetical protein